MKKDIEYNYFGMEVTHMDEIQVFDNIKPGKIGLQFTGS